MQTAVPTGNIFPVGVYIRSVIPGIGEWMFSRRLRYAVRKHPVPSYALSLAVGNIPGDPEIHSRKPEFDRDQAEAWLIETGIANLHPDIDK
jgi:hypothetical protein